MFPTSSMNKRLKNWFSIGLFLLCFGITTGSVSAETPLELLRQEDVAGGLVVQVGCKNAGSISRLRLDDGFRVLGLDTRADRIKAARLEIQDAGAYGPVSADRFDGRRFPLIDGIVNVLIVAERFELSDREIQRVLCPEGVAFVAHGGQWNRTEKARPESIDAWTHFLHDPSNNAVADDDKVDLPRRLQWTSGPRYSRHHDHMASVSAMVSNGPQVFTILDRGSRWSIFLPADWHLVARDSFNGAKLWDKPMGKWFTHHYSLKSGPGDLPRRLVAVGDEVYFTPALDAPVEKVDAATGETLHCYEQTAATEEIIYDNGLLLLKVNSPDNQLQFDTVREARKNNGGVPFDLDPRHIMAVEAESGETLWQRESVVMPTTLATDGQRVYYHDGENVVGLNRETGEELWKQPVNRWSKMLTFFTPTLVVYDGVVLFAGGEKMIPHRGGKDTMTAMDAETGKVLWTGYHGASGYQSAEDLLVSGGLVWSGETTNGGYSGQFTGRDPKTGEVKCRFEPDVETYWFHHRCYRGKATQNYLLMSRTGIEFLDPEEESWTINHWVRGGCLYGIMPCNGLIYTPPTNCACYPEIKLYGFNALASAEKQEDEAPVVKESARLEKGPGYDTPPDDETSYSASDWPTYRGDNGRSGCTSAEIPPQLSLRWRNKFPGRLSAPVIADGTVYLAAIDQHQVLAVSEENGSRKWTFTAGARIDSPPTVYQGRVYFGSLDGSIYCLQADDGELVWRYLAAPNDTRLVAYEQVESLWPVRGSVLIQDDRLYALAGRNAFLDGGLRLVILDPATGELLADNVFDDTDPATGKDLQNRVKILNMPTGLNDILSSDGKNIYWMSQVMDKDGNRGPLGPHSGKPREQGSVQRGETAHLYAPFGGYLDGDWFHRSYWIFGRSFAGGHSGYHQAGKYTPAGRILVFDDEHVYGFGRKRQYYRWTTPLEYKLFSAEREPLAPEDKRRGKAEKIVQVKNRPALNPAGKPLVVEAWVKPEKRGGVIVARGGPAQGYALVLKAGIPHMVLRSDDDTFSVGAGKNRIVGDWHHVTGVLTPQKELSIYVDGQLAGSKKVPRLIAGEPAQAMEVGSDEQGAVGNYNSPFGLTGLVDDVKVYFGELSDTEIAQHANDNPKETEAANAELVVHLTFDDSKANDVSGHKHHGTMGAVETVEGQFGFAARFEGRRSSQSMPYYVVHNWKKTIPLHVRAMTKAADTLLIMGPPDILDEDEAFAKPLTPKLRERFRAQDEANDGNAGSILMSVDAETGEVVAQQQISALPRWDGMAAANGHVFIVTESGDIMCLGK